METETATRTHKKKMPDSGGPYRDELQAAQARIDSLTREIDERSEDFEYAKGVAPELEKLKKAAKDRRTMRGFFWRARALEYGHLAAYIFSAYFVMSFAFCASNSSTPDEFMSVFSDFHPFLFIPASVGVFSIWANWAKPELESELEKWKETSKEEATSAL